MSREPTPPFAAPDSPAWRAELAVHRKAYRYLEHQRGTIGVLTVRLIEGRDLDRGLDGSRRGGISPQVTIRVANEQARSAAAQGNARPSWQQRFALPLRKGTLQEGQPVLAVFQAVDSSWKSALGGSIIGGRDLGTGSLDILALLNGSRGSHVMDEWVELSPGGGALHVVVEYEPVGMEPQVNDVVFLEAFARSARSLVVPPSEPMVVRAVAGAYLLVGFQSPTARDEKDRDPHISSSEDPPPECRLRVHRNTVFVVERETLVDSAWYGVMDVTAIVGALPPVQWTRKQLQPYTKYVVVLAKPALTSFSIAFAAAKLAARSSMAAMQGAHNTVFSDD